MRKISESSEEGERKDKGKIERVNCSNCSVMQREVLAGLEGGERRERKIE